MDQQLLRQLDDRAVRAADMLGGTALGAQTGNHLNDQIDLVRQ